MNKQEIFDKVWNGLKAQGQACRTENGRCVYRQGELRCAVGLLFDDSELNRVADVDGGILKLERMQLLPERLRPHMGFLMKLQDAHDARESYGQDWWKTVSHRLTKIARDYELEVPK